jgi:YidC/Oxa1 family membrane protein insertase
MPAASLEGNPFAQQQKILLYVLPLVFAVSGVNFPIGVLLYWLTTNVWSMGQQFFVIRRMPAPGSLAEKALNERRAKKGKPLFGSAPADPEPEAVVEQPKGQRVQPKRRDRQRRPAGASDVAAMTPMTARADLTKPARTGAAPRPGVAAGGTGTPAKGARRKGAAQKQVRARGATAVQRSATDDPGASSR